MKLPKFSNVALTTSLSRLSVDTVDTRESKPFSSVNHIKDAIRYVLDNHKGKNKLSFDVEPGFHFGNDSVEELKEFVFGLVENNVVELAYWDQKEICMIAADPNLPCKFLLVEIDIPLMIGSVPKKCPPVEEASDEETVGVESFDSDEDFLDRVKKVTKEKAAKKDKKKATTSVWSQEDLCSFEVNVQSPSRSNRLSFGSDEGFPCSQNEMAALSRRARRSRPKKW